MRIVTANKLNRLWKNGFLPKLGLKIDKTKVLTTVEQVAANTNAENIAGATAVKTIYNNLTSHPQFIYDASGKITGYKTKGGADTVFPFSNVSDISYNCTLRCVGDTVPSTATVLLPDNFKSIDISVTTSAASYGNRNTGFFLIDSLSEIKQMPNKNGTYNFTYSKEEIAGATKIVFNSGKGNNSILVGSATINFL